MENFLENTQGLSGLGYVHLTDFSEKKIMLSSMYHGGNGLFTYQGVPKAGYYAYKLLGDMEGELIAKGKGFVVTRMREGRSLRIGLYHYCHYNLENHITYALPTSAQQTIDRYYAFEDNGVLNFRIYLRNMKEGIYVKNSYIINREHGSSYDMWMSMGAPEVITSQHTEYLSKISEPAYKYEKLLVDDTGDLLVSAVLDVHEVRLICIEKK